MRKLILGLLATFALAAPIALASSASAYVAPTDRSYVGTNSAGTIVNVDMEVELVGTGYYHQFDLAFTCFSDSVITFTGVGEQFDNDGEKIDGVIDTANRTLTYSAAYFTAGQPDGRNWSATGTLAGTATFGDIDWSAPDLKVNGGVVGLALRGGLHNVPNCAPAPAPGNHGQYVSGAVKAGLKGQALKDIAKDVTLVGPYGG